jgi:ABC-2 type transport system permease protein
VEDSLAVLSEGAWTGQGFIQDIDSGVMASLMTMPLRRSALVGGQIGTQATVCLLQSIVVLFIGWLCGARYAGGLGGLLIALVVALILCVAFSSMSNAIALLTRSGMALIGIAQILVLPMAFLSSTMMPTSLMPAWVRSIALVNPQSWAVNLGRAAVNGTLGDPTGGVTWTDAAWQASCLLALAALLFLWSLRALRSFQRAQ